MMLSDRRTFLIFVLYSLSLLIYVRTEEIVEFDEENGENHREGKYMLENWHAIQKTIPEGATGWIPQDAAAGSMQMKRRRLRKRKRRPTIHTYFDPNLMEPVKRVPEIRPMANPLLEEIIQEDSVRPYIRRKDTPPFNSHEDQEGGTILNNPLGVSISFGSEENNNAPTSSSSSATTTTTTNKPPNLKEILKQNGGISLSEILQQKNITLAELLMGKHEALKALTESTPLIVVEEATTTTQKIKESYKRIPPSSALRQKNALYRRPQSHGETLDSLTSKEVRLAQKKRMNLLQGHNINKSNKPTEISILTKYDTVPESTTISRSVAGKVVTMLTTTTEEPKITSTTLINSAPILEQTEAATTKRPTLIMITKERPTNKQPSITISSQLIQKYSAETTTIKSLPEEEEEEENYPKMMQVQLIKTNLKEKMSIPFENNPTTEKINFHPDDEPLHMTINLEESNVPEKMNTSSSSSSSAVTEEAPKLEPHTAKDEINEILQDPISRAGLARILQARNMTFEELIEQRERGSSQLHLADIFHNNTREPEPLDEAVFEGKINSEEMPVFFRQAKQLEEVTEESATVEQSSSSSSSMITHFPSHQIDVNTPIFPWETFFPEIINTNNKPGSLKNLNEIIKPTDIFAENINILDEIDQQLLYSHASKNEPINIFDENPPRKILNISQGVKSAIVASLAIIVLSMIVFVTILVVFRWLQKRKNKLNERDSLTPTLLNRKRRNIKTFVSETLGRNKINYYQRHIQNSSDDNNNNNNSWDRESIRRPNVF